MFEPLLVLVAAQVELLSSLGYISDPEAAGGCLMSQFSSLQPFKDFCPLFSHGGSVCAQVHTGTSDPLLLGSLFSSLL